MSEGASLTSLEYAQAMDKQDPLASFRAQFHLPPGPDGQPAIYLCGNSLGLQPKSVASLTEQELHKWATLGVEGHFAKDSPWFSFDEPLLEPVAALVGASPEEVAVMNGLTVNLHLLMVSFYRPTASRYKIMIEDHAFPSDRYAVASQAQFHGYALEDAIIALRPREGEETLRTEDIESVLAEQGHEIALVMLGGVNYYTGQVMDMARITALGHKAGCVVGFDLAHAAGNVPMSLHEWGVDFAAWCSYKYLNSGPGGVSCCFVHEKHAMRPELPRFAGWWGNDPAQRFAMPKQFSPQRGAGGWQLSNAPVFGMIGLKASLAIFQEATMTQLRQKSLKLTGYLSHLLDTLPVELCEVLTPREANARGCQLSLRIKTPVATLFEQLQEKGVICDVRDDVIRIAPTPLYNTFVEVWTFWRILRDILA